MIKKKFLQSYLKCIPKTHCNYYKQFQYSNKLIIHHPLIANILPITQQTSLFANSDINAKNTILQLDSLQSFNNSYLVGADRNQSQAIQAKLTQAFKQSEILQKDQIQNAYKIIIQIWANKIQIERGQMPLKNYAYTLIQGSQTAINDLNNYQSAITSPHLLNIKRSNDRIIHQLYRIITSNVIKWEMTEEDFRLIFHNYRKFFKRVKDPLSPAQNYLDFIAPFISNLQYSLNPNCRIVGKYFTHLKSSFLCLQSTRKINEGQQITIPYMQQYNDYQILLRYGHFCEQVLKERKIKRKKQFLLIVDLMKDSNLILEQGDIDRKMLLLKKNGLKMKNNIRLKPQGQINQEDFMMLRILYTGQQDGIKSQQKDNYIYHMLAQNSQQFLRFLNSGSANGQSKLNKNDPVCLSIKQIQTTEKQILEQFINKRLKN